MNKLYFIGNDIRSDYLKDMYLKQDMMVDNIIDSKYIITSIPFSKDGKYLTNTNIKIEDFLNNNDFNNKVLFTFVINKEIEDLFNKYNIQYYDLMKLDELAILNAIPTAEGAISKAITNSDITLSNNNVLVLGYGRVGKVLSDKLKGLGCNVHISARKDKDLALIKALKYIDINLNDLDKYLSKFDYIFNTVPNLILDKYRLNMVKRNVCIIDLASYPGGVDYEYCKLNNINAELYLGIPGKVAPLTSSKYIKDIIDKLINM